MKNKNQMTIYDRLFQLLESEFMNKSNYFYILASKFADTFVEKYSIKLSLIFEYSIKEKKQILTIFEKEDYEEISKFIEELIGNAVKQIKEFELFIKEIIGYLTKTFLHPRLDKKLSNLIYRMIFNGKFKCYECLMDLIRAKNFKNENQLKENMYKLKDMKPKDFDVPNEFCLPDKPIPYLDVIDCINFLEIYTTPQDKLDCIYQMKKLIAKEFEDCKLHDENSIQAVKIGGDITLSIISYCVLRSSNERLLDHMDMISYFQKYVELNDYGDDKEYYLITLEIAVKYLLKYNFKFDDKN